MQLANTISSSSNNEIQTFLECEGNLALAVEKAQTTRARFLYALSQNPEALKQALNTLLLVNLANTLPRLQQVLLDSLKNLEPAEAAKAYGQIANIIAHVSTPANANPTFNQFNMNQFNLTPELREALTILQPTANNDG